MSEDFSFDRMLASHKRLHLPVPPPRPTQKQYLLVLQKHQVAADRESNIASLQEHERFEAAVDDPYGTHFR